MKLINFYLDTSIELNSEGLNWDLHNFADFTGLELVPTENAAVLRWRAPKVENPWGSFQNKYAGVELWFRNLEFLKIGPRDEELPLTEDTCVADILQVDPAIQAEEPRLRAINAVEGGNGQFHLCFVFQSGRTIEIGSQRVELVPVE
jgi:hypothetical protein